MLQKLPVALSRVTDSLVTRQFPFSHISKFSYSLSVIYLFSNDLLRFVLYKPRKKKPTAKKKGTPDRRLGGLQGGIVLQWLESEKHFYNYLQMLRWPVL